MAGQPGAYGGGTGIPRQFRWPNWMPKPNSTRPGGRFGPTAVPTLPSYARVPSQYPAGVPTGVGGGNAGASGPDSPSLRPLRVPVQPSALFQPPTPAAPGLSNVVRPVTGRGGRERAYAAMVQQAGLSSEELGQARVAAQEAGEIANQQRLAQGGKGYLSSGSLDPRLDPSRQEYWDRADIKAWAAVPSHQAMVQTLQKKHGYTPLSPIEQVTRPLLKDLPQWAVGREDDFSGESTTGFAPNINLGVKVDPMRVASLKAFEGGQEPYWGPEVEAMNNVFTATPDGPKRFAPDVDLGVTLQSPAPDYSRAFSPASDQNWGPETTAAASILGEHLNRIKSGSPPADDPEEQLKKLGIKAWNTKLNY